MALISHGFRPHCERGVDSVVKRIRKRGDLGSGTVEEQLALIRELDAFPLGRWILRNQGGLNAEWTNYLIACPPPPEELSCELEWFLVYEAPSVQASRERYWHFQDAIQAELYRAHRIASIPCGRMSEVLTLAPEDLQGVEIFGLDLDSDALRLAQSLAVERRVGHQVSLRRGDAWNLDLSPEFDLITTNGLTIYESSEAKVADLYRRLAAGLVPGGLLVTSYLTPPPDLDRRSSWDPAEYDPEALRLESLIFRDICGATWQNHRTEAVLAPMFDDAGLDIERVIWDRARAFPTVLLRKR